VNLSLLNGNLVGGVDSLRQVEAKYPALLFKQQLTAYVEKIYGMIRDNLKKEISPLLGLCIQVILICAYPDYILTGNSFGVHLSILYNFVCEHCRPQEHQERV